MDLSTFLAKVMGLYLLIMAVAMYVNMRKIKAMVKEANAPMFMLASGAKSLLLGLLIVVSHNVWDGTWRSLISLLGWVLLVRGVLRLLVPDYAFKMIKKVVQSSAAYCTISFVLLIIGAYLSYIGFMG